MNQEYKPLTTAPDAAPRHRVAMGVEGSTVYRCETRQPLIVFGPQRSGKTTGVVIPAVLEWDGPCLVTSVRFDVIAATLEHRSSLGEVFIFDPAGLTESIGRRFAPHCVGWSPLDSIKVWDDAVRQAESLSSGTDLGGLGGVGDFWATHARLLLTPFLYAAARTRATMGDVLEWLNTGSHSKMIDLLIDRQQRFDPEPTSSGWQRCISRLTAYASYAENTYSSVCATAATMLEAFALEGVDRRCSATRRLPLETFLDGGAHTLFLCAPPHQQRRFMPLFTALARQAVSETIDRNGVPGDDGQAIIEVPLMLCLDEAGNIARLDDLDTFATTAAGSGIQLISVFHDMSQLRATYDEDRGALIVNNHRGKLFLPGNSDTRTGSFLHEQLHSSDVRGHSHLGWEQSDLREMRDESVLCLYGGLPAKLLGLRRWNETSTLSKAVETARHAYRVRPPASPPPLPPSAFQDLESAASLEELYSLGDFILESVDRLDLGRRILPCWFAHRGAVDIILALVPDGGGEPGDNVILEAADQVAPLLGRCRAGHLPTPPARPAKPGVGAHRILLEHQIRLLEQRDTNATTDRANLNRYGEGDGGSPL
ncbi:hypothetical protein GCM10010306_039170 [Streptomyces umbrinus]|uniref:type IV secretory system conjugative DNA transfer family protein n=1 Tax=Streptomyces umbrinus TaxID=67370 RepID=UPI00167C0618|nr:type IV secretory system conjugative DNA transfer family protein [Streptomyces umbrinus]GHB41730.1 hypothetical protein GCM10010306_039170 [Streptomyces umbrinus]